MKKTFSRARLILVQLLVCLALVAGILMFSVAPAYAASTPHAASTSHTVVHPDSSGCYLVIRYNAGSNYYCVTTTGYNGINRALYDVIEIDASVCTNAYWVVYHTSETSSGIQRYYYGSVIDVDFYKLTQVDVYATSCTP